jgi:diaminopimelate epimerase
MRLTCEKGGGIGLQFTKMNGAGNDFIILNNLEEHIAPEKLPVVARVLCDRHLSIGADGLMAVDRAEGRADFKMRFYNSDGSVGEMCGNGARCICRYGYEHGLAGERQTIETTAGVVTGERLDKRNYRIRLNSPTTVRLHEPVALDGRTIDLSYVELGCPGLPHAAVEYPGLKDADGRKLFDLGRALRYHPDFPKGANVNFFEIIGPDELLEKTYERGVEDFTYACGTGTGSVVTALTLLGRVSGKGVRVHMAGGTLVIDAEREGDAIKNLYLTGPTNTVAAGEVLDEELPNI